MGSDYTILKLIYTIQGSRKEKAVLGISCRQHCYDSFIYFVML